MAVLTSGGAGAGAVFTFYSHMAFTGEAPASAVLEPPVQMAWCTSIHIRARALVGSIATNIGHGGEEGTLATGD